MLSGCQSQFDSASGLFGIRIKKGIALEVRGDGLHEMHGGTPQGEASILGYLGRKGREDWQSIWA
jgi:hypothetical protein